MRSLTRIGSVVLVAAALALSAAVAPSVAAGSPSGQAAKLRDAITVSAMRQHLQALQNIASANGNTRESGTPGYEASVDYVVSQLEAAAITRSSSRSSSTSSRSSRRRPSSAWHRIRGRTWRVRRPSSRR